MFLGVSGTVLGMEMNENERLALGLSLQRMRTMRFKNNKKAAYTAAGVNSATWERAEQGLPIRPQSLTAILLALIPDSEGDWENLKGERGGIAVRAKWIVGPADQDDRGFVESPGDVLEEVDDKATILRMLERMDANMQAMDQRLSERLDRLEQRGAEPVDGAGGQN